VIVNPAVSEETPARFQVTIKAAVCTHTVLSVDLPWASSCKPLAEWVPIVIRHNVSFQLPDLQWQKTERCSPAEILFNLAGSSWGRARVVTSFTIAQ
jgi:hypothetical protein